MIQLPEAHELLWFFECEPQVLDPGIPWCYNRITFVTTRSDGVVNCAIEPASGEIELIWTSGDRKILDMRLAHLSKLSVSKVDDRELLLAEFDERASYNCPFVFQLKPYVSASWCMQQNA